MLDPAYVNGFDDPVQRSQNVFRLLLNAMASPGTIVDVEESLQVAPPSLGYAASSILLAMADLETPIWISGQLRTDTAERWVRFHTGANLTEDRALATFSLISGADADGNFESFARGEERYPERSTTVIVVCESLDGGHVVNLTGPGIEDAHRVAPRVLREGFWTEVQRNHAMFPLGVDLIFVAGTSFFCLPRSTRVDLKASL